MVDDFTNFSSDDEFEYSSGVLVDSVFDVLCDDFSDEDFQYEEVDARYYRVSKRTLKAGGLVGLEGGKLGTAYYRSVKVSSDYIMLNLLFWCSMIVALPVCHILALISSGFQKNCAVNLHICHCFLSSVQGFSCSVFPTVLYLSYIILKVTNLLVHNYVQWWSLVLCVFYVQWRVLK